MRWIHFIATCLLVTVFTVPAHAGKVYKWVDANGNVTYSSTPPPDKSKATTVKTQRSHISDEEAKKRLESLSGQATGRRKNREYLEGSESESAAVKDRRSKNCETAKKNLQVLQSSGRVQASGDDGQKFYLDEAVRQRKIEETQGQIAEFCGAG